MFIPEMTYSLTVSNWLGQFSFINLKYCLLLNYASNWLDLSISVYTLVLKLLRGLSRIDHCFMTENC